MSVFLSNMTGVSQYKLSTLNAFDTDPRITSDQGLPSLLQAHTYNICET